MTTWLKPDWYYPPIDVASDETTIVYLEDSGGTISRASFDVTAQTYWCIHTLTTTPSTGYAELFGEIESKMTSNSPNGLTYTISAAQTHEETSSPSATSTRKIGVKYENDSTEADNVDTTFEFGNGNFTFPPELLGWEPGRSTDATYDNLEFGAPHSNVGRWSPMVRYENDGASMKSPPQPMRRTARSDEDVKRSYDLQIDETRYRRRILYEKVGATSIQEGRAALSGYDTLDEVASGEMNNALIDHYDRAADLDLWMVVHDNDDKQLYGQLQDGTEKWETLAFQEPNDGGDFFEMTDRHPEMYEVEMRYEIRETEYDQ